MHRLRPDSGHTRDPCRAQAAGSAGAAGLHAGPATGPGEGNLVGAVIYLPMGNDPENDPSSAVSAPRRCGSASRKRPTRSRCAWTMAPALPPAPRRHPLSSGRQGAAARGGADRAPGRVERAGSDTLSSRSSTHPAHASSSMSASWRPTSCTPSGSPCGPAPKGRVTQGTPSSVSTRLKSELPVVSSRPGASPGRWASPGNRSPASGRAAAAGNPGRAPVRHRRRGRGNP